MSSPPKRSTRGLDRALHGLRSRSRRPRTAHAPLRHASVHVATTTCAPSATNSRAVAAPIAPGRAGDQRDLPSSRPMRRIVPDKSSNVLSVNSARDDRLRASRDGDRPRRHVRRPAPAGADDDLLEPRQHRGPVPRGAAGRPALRARAARGLGGGHGGRLRARARRTRTGAAALDAWPGERGRRARHRAPQPRAAGGRRRPAGPPPPRAGPVPGRPAARAGGRVPGVRPTSPPARRTSRARSSAPTTRPSPAAAPPS